MKKNILLIAILEILVSCSTFVRRNEVYSIDANKSKEACVESGRVLTTQFALTLTPIPLLPVWQNTYIYNSYYFNIRESEKCPTIELNERFYRTRMVLYDSLSHVTMCKAKYLPLQNNTEVIRFKFTQYTCDLELQKDVKWFWGLCGYGGYCEEDFEGNIEGI